MEVLEHGKLHRLTSREICKAYPDQAGDHIDNLQRKLNAANKLIRDVAFRIMTNEIKMGCLHGLAFDVQNWAAKHPKAEKLRAKDMPFNKTYKSDL